jgi:hypothetical protein
MSSVLEEGHMTRTSTFIAILTTVSLAAVGAQDHLHPGDALGTVHFQTSCSTEIAASFTRAVALLLRGGAPYVRGRGGPGCPVRHGTLGHRNDVVAPALGPADR